MSDVTTASLSPIVQSAGSTRFETAFVNAPIGMSVISPAGRWLQVNQALCQLLGYSEEELCALNVFDLAHPDDDQIAHDDWRDLVGRGADTSKIEIRYRRRDGRTVWVAITSTMLRDAGGSPLYAVSQTEDITPRKEAEDAMLVSEQRYSDLFERCNDLIFTLDLNGVMTSVNPAAERITGFPPAELVGKRLIDLVVDTDAVRAGQMFDNLLDGSDETTELEVITKGGRSVFIEASSRLVMDGERAIGIEGIARDTTVRHALQEELALRAFYDSLTGLPNRALFLDRLGQAVARLKRPEETVAVMLLGIDDFKTVNKERGHAVGDELLKALTPRLQEKLRGSDTAARLGGDQFGLIIESLQNEQQVMMVAERILGTISESSVAGPITASLGIALADANSSPEALLENADTAMTRAKKHNRGGSVVFSAEVRSLRSDHTAPAGAHGTHGDVSTTSA